MPPRTTRTGIAIVVLLGAAFVAYASQTAALHCDETNVFRQATRFAHGDFRAPGRPGLLWLALAPLTWLSDPLLATRALRAAAAVASLLTLIGVAAVSSRDEEQTDAGSWGAIAAVGLLATSLSWQGHAFEVRTDTFAVPLSLIVMIQLWRPNPGLKRAAFAGALIAAMGLISQKSVYNAAAIAAGWAVYVAATPGPWALRARAREAVVAGGVALAGIGAWFAGLATLNPSGSGTVGHTFAVAKRTAFGLSDFTLTKKLEILGQAFERAPVLYVLAAAGVVSALVTARRRPVVAAATTAAVVMLCTIFVHRGFRTYYVASFEPYLAISAGALVASFGALVGQRAGRAAPAVAAAVAIVAGGWFGAPHVRPLLETDARHQFEVMRVARDTFDEPVPYIDLLGLLPGWNEVTFLGTGPQRTLFRKRAGDAAADLAPDPEQRTRARRRAESRAFIGLFQQRKPLLFLHTYMSRDRYFKKPELRWLWTHYLPYRSNVYLHGGRMRVGPDEALKGVELLATGEYTVWFRGGWRGEAQVDGRPVAHAQVVELEEGEHLLLARAEQGGGELWLLLGRDRVPEAEEPKEVVDLSMFPRDRRDRFQQYDRKRRKDLSDLLTPAWDPTMTDDKHRARRKRHRRWQEKRSTELGQP